MNDNLHRIKAINKKLINENRKAKLIISELLLNIEELESTFEIRFFEALDALRKDYGTFLNPKPERISISKSESAGRSSICNRSR